jgi:hypothetical protein
VAEIAENLGYTESDGKLEAKKRAIAGWEINTIHKNLCSGKRKKNIQEGLPVKRSRQSNIVVAQVLAVPRPPMVQEDEEMRDPSREGMEREEQRHVENRTIRQARMQVYFQQPANNRAISHSSGVVVLPLQQQIGR